MLETLLRSDSKQCELGKQVTKLCLNREPGVNGIETGRRQGRKTVVGTTGGSSEYRGLDVTRMAKVHADTSPPTIGAWR